MRANAIPPLSLPFVFGGRNDNNWGDRGKVPAWMRKGLQTTPLNFRDIERCSNKVNLVRQLMPNVWIGIENYDYQLEERCNLPLDELGIYRSFFCDLGNPFEFGTRIEGGGFLLCEGLPAIIGAIQQVNPLLAGLIRMTPKPIIKKVASDDLQERGGVLIKGKPQRPSRMAQLIDNAKTDIWKAIRTHCQHSPFGAAMTFRTRNSVIGEPRAITLEGGAHIEENMRKAIMIFDIEIAPGYYVRVHAFHLQQGGDPGALKIRKKQVHQVADVVRESPYPVLLFTDANPVNEKEIDVMMKTWGLKDAGKHRGPTYRWDNIFAKRLGRYQSPQKTKKTKTKDRPVTKSPPLLQRLDLIAFDPHWFNLNSFAVIHGYERDSDHDGVIASVSMYLR